MSPVPSKDRFVLGPLMWLGMIAVIAILHACNSEPTKTVQTAGNSFFPLAVGNRWYFRADRAGDGHAAAETVFVDAQGTTSDRDYYHLRCSWPGFQSGLWVRRDPLGNLSWSAGGDSPEHLFLLFNASVGTVWQAGLPECTDSLKMNDDYAVVTTPYGRFDGVREIGNVGPCADIGWGVRAARGVGPVAFMRITIGGPINFLLSGFVVKDDATTAASSDHSNKNLTR